MAGGTQRRVKEALTSGITWDKWSKLTPEEQEAVAFVNPVVKQASRPMAYDADTGEYRPAKEGEEVVADEGTFLYLGIDPNTPLDALPRETITALGKLYGHARYDTPGHRIYSGGSAGGPGVGMGYGYSYRNNPNPFVPPTAPPNYRTMRLYESLKEGPLPPEIAQIYGKEVGPVIDYDSPFVDYLIPQVSGDAWADEAAFFKEHPEISGYGVYDWTDQGLGKEGQDALLQRLAEGWQQKAAGRGEEGQRFSQKFSVPFIPVNIDAPAGGDLEKSLGGYNWIPGNWDRGSLVSPELTLKNNPDAKVIGSYYVKAKGGTLGQSYGKGGMRVMKGDGGRYVRMS